jgi:GDP-D-mannose 3', 5'-epimerase
MKKVLVCGAGGFIGHHLVNRLKDEGFWVRGIMVEKKHQQPCAEKWLKIRMEEK